MHGSFFTASAIHWKNTKFGPVILVRITKNRCEPNFWFLPQLPRFGPFLLLLCNNYPKLCNNDPKMGNQGKNQKSGSEQFFVILRRVTGPNLVFFRWMTEAVKKFPCKSCVLFTYISYIFPYTFSDNCRNHANFADPYLNNEKRFFNSVKSSWKCITYIFRNMWPKLL